MTPDPNNQIFNSIHYTIIKDTFYPIHHVCVFFIAGALDQIDWSKQNEVSIHTKKEKKQAPVAPITRDQLPGDRHSGPPIKNAEDVPVNRYQSVVAPVKSGKLL